MKPKQLQRPSSLSQRKLMQPKIKRMIWHYKFHLIAEMMLFIWVLCIWALQLVNQLELYSIQVLNTLLSLVLFAMIRHPVTLNLRSMIHCQDRSFKEINLHKDVALQHMICIKVNPTRFYLKLHPNLPMVQQSFKVSYGRTIPVSNH